jgi:hypothetical protein
MPVQWLAGHVRFPAISYIHMFVPQCTSYSQSVVVMAPNHAGESVATNKQLTSDKLATGRPVPEPCLASGSQQ